jgi:hypothetical protein
MDITKACISIRRRMQMMSPYQVRTAISRMETVSQPRAAIRKTTTTTTTGIIVVITTRNNHLETPHMV